MTFEFENHFTKSFLFIFTVSDFFISLFGLFIQNDSFRFARVSLNPFFSSSSFHLVSIFPTWFKSCQSYHKMFLHVFSACLYCNISLEYMWYGSCVMVRNYYFLASFFHHVSEYSTNSISWLVISRSLRLNRETNRRKIYSTPLTTAVIIRKLWMRQKIYIWYRFPSLFFTNIFMADDLTSLFSPGSPTTWIWVWLASRSLECDWHSLVLFAPEGLFDRI